MPVKKPNDDIIIRIPRKFFTSDVRNMLSLIEHKKLVSKSRATEKEIKKIEIAAKKQRGKDVQVFLQQKGLLLS